mgnify:CR=1 FL=1
MILKKIFYKLPFNIQSYIARLSSYINNGVIDDFINSPYGSQYGLTVKDRVGILKRLKISLSTVDSATSLEAQITLIKEVLNIKKKIKNKFIVECGCYKGSSTIALSIAAKIIGAKLIIYDSFKGLPISEKQLGKRLYPHLNIYGYYRAGMYSGSLDEVKKNINLFGELDVCIFRVGLFSKSLKKHKERIQLCFIDVDLSSSTQDCIKYLWKKLDDNSYFYSDDACDLKVVSIWFDKVWWKKNLNIKPPGYVGSGCGLPINGNYSGIGYSFKKKNLKSKNKIHWLYSS